MANLKEVRTRIESVNSTKQITSAMKMVAASKLRRAQNAITTMRPYAAKLQELMQDLNRSVEQANDNKYAVVRPAEKILLVPVTSNRGLCGAFNTNVIRATVKLINEDYEAQHKAGNLKVFCIGKKGEEFFKSRKISIYKVNNHVFDNLVFSEVVPIAQELMDIFVAGEFDQILFVYNQFKNAATQLLIHEQFLPVEMPQLEDDKQHEGVDYIFEPGKDEILDELIPKSLKIQVYKMLLDSFASEHGARMTAMHKATDNATELLKDLKLSYNKARQAAITNEILEIVGGANALNG
ncbi:MAG: ATP synthase F1 subunit gamma [Bacteroidales bacterium]|jgi:F-type H+-transporting ATPase subunit gamma|nr:ATP synthase F1 subunit gamma [Bacteroidales bacterium]MDN5349518.1 F-type H+-transporting ATPase subunit gamma [Bacteroidales bacterium]